MIKTVKRINGKSVFFYRSEIIPCPHGFFGAELDFNKNTCQADALRQNIDTAAKILGFEPQRLVSVKQIHSASVREVGADDGGKFYFRAADFDCDGYVTQESGTALGIRTADCVPILLCAADRKGSVAAVSAVHAGWRGTVGKIAAEAVSKLCKLGASTENIYAAVGPSICPDCFEVGEDFRVEVSEKLGSAICQKYVTPKANSNGKYLADLWAMNAEQLMSCGIPENNIDICRICTRENNVLSTSETRPDSSSGVGFFSHRAQGTPHGTQISIIVMPYISIQ